MIRIPPIHHRSLYRIENKIVEEPQGLSGSLKATYVNRAALARFLFRGQQIHAKWMTSDLEGGGRVFGVHRGNREKTHLQTFQNIRNVGLDIEKPHTHGHRASRSMSWVARRIFPDGIPKDSQER